MWQRSGNNVSLALWVCVWVNIHATCMLLLPVTFSMHAFYPLRTISPVPILAPSVSIVFCLLLMNAFDNNATKWWFLHTQFTTHYEIKSKSKYWFATLKWKFKSDLKLGRSLRDLDGFFMVFYGTYEEIFEILNKSINQNLIEGKVSQRKENSTDICCFSFPDPLSVEYQISLHNVNDLCRMAKVFSVAAYKWSNHCICFAAYYGLVLLLMAPGKHDWPMFVSKKRVQKDVDDLLCCLSGGRWVKLIISWYCNVVLLRYKRCSAMKRRCVIRSI